MKRQDIITAAGAIALASGMREVIAQKPRVNLTLRNTRPWKHPRPNAFRLAKTVFDTALA